MYNKIDYNYIIKNIHTNTFIRKDMLSLRSFPTRGDAVKYLLDNGFDLKDYMILEKEKIENEP